jgi:hypothetical protein
MKNRSSWLLLLYGLPTKHGTARVSLWRKLKKFGAVQLKSSAYVLPDNPEHFERFQWLSKQIQDNGGGATLIRAAHIEGVSNEQMMQMFVSARDADYRELITAARESAKRVRGRKHEALAADLEKLRRRFAEIQEIDYFKSPTAHDAEVALQQMEKVLAPAGSRLALPQLDAKEFKGKTWVTRPRPGIDRAGSAWLIRRFIDPKARFVFGTDPSRHPKSLPFDMSSGEFSHHGNDCTFETLAKRFDIKDNAVAEIAEMIHDADLEDGKFQRVECIGINAVLGGWAKSPISDSELLEKGIECFEGLYQKLRR